MTLRQKVLCQAFSRIDRMTAEELLTFIDRPLVYACERAQGSAQQTATEYAMARLDILTR